MVPLPKVFLRVFFISRKCLYILKTKYGSFTQYKLFSLKVWKESLFRHIKRKRTSKWFIKEYFFQTTGRVEGRVLESTGNPVESAVSVIGGGRGSAEGIPHDQLHKGWLHTCVKNGIVCIVIVSSVLLGELVKNFKIRNLMQSDFSLSLLWLFDLLNFEVSNLLRINEIHGCSSLALIWHFLGLKS